MNTSDNPNFNYMSASALASRRIIDKSSYTTTPDHSSADATPPCGEWVKKQPLDGEKLKKINLILQIEQNSGTKAVEPSSKK
jgi:hypothetical protein